MKLPAYPRTKPSGVEWLGDVPEHWETKKVTYGFSRIGSGTTPKSDSDDFYDGDVPWVTTSELRETVITKTKECVTRSALAAHSALRLYPTGTLLFAMYGATIGRLGILGIPATVNQACCSFAAPTLFDTRFVFYWLWMRRPILISLSTGGGQPNLSQDDLRQIRISTPPLAEQRAIAAFLDRETGRVDRLVAKKRDLIERLKEKRTALISRTVTRGLPPAAARAAGLPANPPLKPSALDWLGDIPKHWRVMALKWRSRCRSGDAISTEDVSPEPTPERGIPVIGGNGVMGYCDSSNCNHPVLVIGRVGALCGNVHLITPPAWITDNALVMPTDAATFSQKYLAAVLRTRNLNELADKTAQPLITGTRVRNERIPVPPLPEQAAIAAYLDLETAKLDALVGKVEEAVERLQEYRTALITAAVTGKIDVRDKPASG